MREPGESETPAVPASSPPLGERAGAPAAVALVIAALYLGREIFVPLALAILLAFVLSPPILWLRRHGLPRIAAIVVVIGLALAAAASVVAAVGLQLVTLADNLPRYQRNIEDKLVALRATAPGGGLFERVTSTLQDMQRELSGPERPRQSRSSDGRQQPAPIPVVIEPAPLQPLQVLQTVVSPLLGPLGTAALVVLFVIFILLEREELRDRFIKLVSGGDLQRSTEAITEAGSRVSRYLLMQLVVNVSYGIPIGIGLAVIGVPNAALWGVLAAVLRFIPYLGAWIAALFPLVIAFGSGPGWTMLLLTSALFIGVELISNNVVEPWLYGSSTGLSSFAIIVAAIFWTLLWGPVGLLLATPLTACLVVIGRFVPSMEFLGVLLGSDPVLSPAERFYQRLLSDDVDEVMEMAERHVEEVGSRAFYDEVVLPALRLAENDRQRNLDVGMRRAVSENVTTVAREVEQLDIEAGKKSDGKPIAEASEPSRVLCIAGRTELDLAAAEVLAARLRECSITVKTIPALALSRAGLDRLDLDEIEVVCLSYLHPSPRASARAVCRHLERRRPGIAKIVCCWNLGDPASAQDLQTMIGAGAVVVTSVESAEAKALAALERDIDPPAAAVTEPETKHLGELLKRTGLTSGAGPWFADLSAIIEQRLDLPTAIVAPRTEPAPPAQPNADSEKPAPRMELKERIWAEVEKANETIVIDDVAEDDRFSDNSELLEKGVRFFAATPLRDPDGVPFGALAALGAQPREFDEVDRRQLESIAADLVSRIAAEELPIPS